VKIDKLFWALQNMQGFDDLRKNISLTFGGWLTPGTYLNTSTLHIFLYKFWRESCSHIEISLYAYILLRCWWMVASRDEMICEQALMRWAHVR